MASRTGGCLAAVIAASWLLMGPASAQTALAQTPPSQNANRYDGKAHQPDPSAAAPAPRQSGTTIQQLDQQVQQHAVTSTGTAAGCSADQKVCPP